MTFRSILITGASSGLGAALARRYAAPGIRLALIGRNADRLAAIASETAALGAEIVTATLDVCDASAMRATLHAWDDDRPFDLILANAGISAGTGAQGEDEGQLRAITATNIDGVINSIAPLIPRLIARRSGQIALMASLAGYRGLPGAPAYCASKAWVMAYGEALRPELAAHNIGVSVICPGFVVTPMTDVNPFPMPFLMPATKAADIIRHGLAANRPRIAFPAPMVLAVWLISLLPARLFDSLVRFLPKKN